MLEYGNAKTTGRTRRELCDQIERWENARDSLATARVRFESLYKGAAEGSAELAQLTFTYASLSSLDRQAKKQVAELEHRLDVLTLEQNR